VCPKKLKKRAPDAGGKKGTYCQGGGKKNQTLKAMSRVPEGPTIQKIKGREG